MPIIEADDGTIVHINVFTCAPENQQALVDSLTDAVNAARTVPGWLSASIHRSFDGRQVTNYVQFASHEAAKAVVRLLMSEGLLQKNLALGAVAPGQYEVVYTSSAD